MGGVTGPKGTQSVSGPPGSEPCRMPKQGPPPPSAPGPLGSGPVACLPANRLQETGSGQKGKCYDAHPKKSQQSNHQRKHTHRKRGRKGGFFLLSTCQTLQKVTLLPSNFNHSGNFCIPSQEELSLLYHKVSKAGNLKTILKHFYLQLTNERSLTDCSAAFEFSVMF